MFEKIDEIFFPLKKINFIENTVLDIPEKIDFYDEEICFDNEILYLTYPNALFKVEKGKSVSYKILLNDSRKFREQLNTSVYAALLMQNEIPPFHASSFFYKNKGVLICADSEVGKSSIAYSFFQEGAEILCDDISPILAQNEAIQIAKNAKELKLWYDSLEDFHIERINLDEVEAKSGKYFLPINPTYSKNLFQLDIIFVLSISESNQFESKKIIGSEKIRVLLDQLFRIRYLKANHTYKKKIFNQIVKIASKTPIFEIQRPADCKIKETNKFIKSILNEVFD